MTCYVVWDEDNDIMETFAGPHRLAKWPALPTGWTIEEFYGDVSRGMVSLDYVKSHAAELSAPLPDYLQRFFRWQATDPAAYRKAVS